MTEEKIKLAIERAEQLKPLVAEIAELTPQIAQLDADHAQYVNEAAHAEGVHKQQLDEAYKAKAEEIEKLARRMETARRTLASLLVSAPQMAAEALKEKRIGRELSAPMVLEALIESKLKAGLDRKMAEESARQQLEWDKSQANEAAKERLAHPDSRARHEAEAIEEGLRFLETLGNDPLARAKRFLALIEPLLVKPAENKPRSTEPPRDAVTTLMG